MTFYGCHDVSFHFAKFMYQNITKYNTPIGKLKNARKLIDRKLEKYVLQRASVSKANSQKDYPDINLCNIQVKGPMRDVLHASNTELEIIYHSTDMRIRRYVEELKRIGRIIWAGIYPGDWPAVALVFIGSGQLVVGAALSVFAPGGGSLLAKGLIAEGIGDIAMAVDRYCRTSDAEFSWTAWAASKLVNITIYTTFSGYETSKNAADTIFSGLKSIIILFKPVVTETVKSGWKLVAKKIGIELGKSVVHHVVFNLLNYALKLLKPIILKKITKKIEGPIQEALINNPILEKMLRLDKRKAMDMLDLKGNTVFQSLALRGFIEERQIIEAFGALSQLQTFVPDYIEQINRFLEIVTNEKNVAEDIEVWTEQQKEFISSNVVKGITEPVCDEIQETSRRIAKELANNVSINMLNIVKDKIISPIIQISIAKCAAILTSSIEKQISIYQTILRVIQLQNEGYKSFREACGRQSDTGVIDKLLKDAESGPCGLPHLGAISDVISKSIRVYDEKDRLKYVIGDEKGGAPVEIQYHKPKEDKPVGHFTLLGGKEPLKQDGGKNMCLFNSIAIQIGVEPRRLKTDTLNFMRIHKIKISEQSVDLLRLETDQNFALNLGGASYHGRSSADAGRYLNESQGVAGFKHYAPGHPRGHASNATREASVEEYSRSSRKSGFDSYEIQNTVTHHALRTQKAREAMDTLNQYDPQYNNDEEFTRQVIRITEDDFRDSGLELPDTAEGGEWVNGQKIKSWGVGTVTVVLQHHSGQQTDASAPVHIQTIYPNYR